MKKLILLFLALGGLVWTVNAQNDPPASPPMEATGQIGKANVSINYSSPGVKGRTIWGELVPYDEVWRSGANASTKITTDRNLTIGGKVLPAGTYSFHSIPRQNGTWTAIFNSDGEGWGSYNYDSSKDVLRVDVKAKKAKNTVERLEYQVKKNAIVLNWENLSIVIPAKAN